MDQLAAMKVFAGVVEQESFTAAADKLGLSRTMTSKHVMDLENHLGARLLNRTTRRLSLTSTGRVYYERAKQVLSEIEEADREATKQSLTPGGQLRINAPMSFGISHIAPHLKAYLDRYPKVEIDLSLNDRLVDLVNEGFDLAIRIGQLSDSSLIARRIAGCPMVACAAPAYLADHGIPEHPSELERHDCLAYAYGGSHDQWRFSDGKAEISVRFTPRVISNNGDALMAAAISGLGVIVQPAFIVRGALKDGRLTEILTSFHAGELGIHAVYPHTRLLSARVRTFIDYLVTRYGDEDFRDN